MGLTLALPACGEKEIDPTDPKWLDQQQVVDTDSDGRVDYIGNSSFPLYAAFDAGNKGAVLRASTKISKEDQVMKISEYLRNRNPDT